MEKSFKLLIEESNELIKKFDELIKERGKTREILVSLEKEIFKLIDKKEEK